MTIVLWLTLAMFAVAVLVGLSRLVTAPDSASRAVVGDLVYFSAIGVIILLGLLHGSAAAVDAALLAALLGILATVALARILTRGRR
ncbi:MAG: monovalent cation/H+ antiporter complex subunit F [Brachybacterium sp.]